MGKETSTNEKK